MVMCLLLSLLKNEVGVLMISKREQIIQAVAVTAELCNKVFTSQVAANAFVDELILYPLEQVLSALKRCQRELKNTLSLADVLNRIDDGRPTTEIAWAIALKSHDESETIVWTEEISQAKNIADSLLKVNDNVGARMAFKEAYNQLVQTARENHSPVNWQASLGLDVTKKELAINEAVTQGLLTAPYAKQLLPMPMVEVNTLSEDSKAQLQAVKKMLANITRQPKPSFRQAELARKKLMHQKTITAQKVNDYMKKSLDSSYLNSQKVA